MRSIVMNVKDDWDSQLRQIYEVDKAHQQVHEKREEAPEPKTIAEQLLRRCRAHELMRQVQKTLLDGGGKLQFYEEVGGYDQAVVLMWSGPISAATKPASIADVDAAIIVGANDGGVFVNDSQLAEASPEALKQVLLELAREFAAQDEP
jgi:hypothetical protein